MLETGRDLDLAQEPLGAQRGGQLRAEHLDGDLAVVLQVVREVNVRHPAAADFSAEVVAGRERGPQAIDHALHTGTHETPRGAGRNTATWRRDREPRSLTVSLA